eukprot:snap_masked-scaffold_11-processed-gene-2.19-mRNA-1 protein AED:1.00 eAED:1.00 QI:0/0/0/0/1/1/2/0/60
MTTGNSPYMNFIEKLNLQERRSNHEEPNQYYAAFLSKSHSMIELRKITICAASRNFQSQI